MSDKGVVEIYRAKSGFQAHMFVLALEEAGIKAEIQGAILHHATSTADNGFTSSSLWCRSVRSAASISMSAVRNCLSACRISFDVAPNRRASKTRPALQSALEPKFRLKFRYPNAHQRSTTSPPCQLRDNRGKLSKTIQGGTPCSSLSTSPTIWLIRSEPPSAATSMRARTFVRRELF